jgi:hypothetical protein
MALVGPSAWFSTITQLHNVCIGLIVEVISLLISVFLYGHRLCERYVRVTIYGYGLYGESSCH